VFIGNRDVSLYFGVAAFIYNETQFSWELSGSNRSLLHDQFQIASRPKEAYAMGIFGKPRNLLLLLLLCLAPAASFAQVAVSIRVGPPALPVYTQPVIPGD